MASDLSIRRRRALWLIVLMLAVFAQHALTLFVPRSLAVYFAYPPVIIVNLVAAYLCWHTSRSYTGKSRLGWTLFALSRLSTVVGFAVWTWYELVFHKEHPVGNAGDFFVIGSDAFVIAGLITVMRDFSHRENWKKTVLEGGAVGAAYFLACWLFFLNSAATHTPQAKTAAISSVASGSSFVILNIFCVALAFLALIRDRLANTTPRRAIIFLGFAVLVNSLTSIGYIGQTANAIFNMSHTLTPAYIDATLLFCAAAYLAEYRKSSTDQMMSAGPRAYAATYTVMAMIAITTPIQYAIHRQTDTTTTAFGAAMVAMVMLRQLLLLNENVSLNEDLETRVVSRTQELMEREQRFRSLVTNSSDVIAILTDEGIVKYVSPSVESVFGYKVDSWLNWKLNVHIDPDEAEVLQHAIDDAKSIPGEPVNVEWSIRHRDGSLCKVESSITALLHEPSVQGIVLNTRDVSERRALEHRLRHQASHDALTGLANRNLFASRMAHVLERAKNHEGSFALLFCDLDEFKAINDSLGHAVGDEVLVEIARRLRSCVRPGDTVARLGGDEFAVVLEHIAPDEDATWIAERIKTEVSQPMYIKGRQIFVGVSVGIATSAADYEHLDDLLAKADIAMYMAKSRGKGNHVSFDPEMHQAILQQMSLEDDLRQALAEDQMVVYYQPIHDLDTQKIVSFEALIRWIHPTRGLISPDDFIPLAESTGIIVDLGRWILQQACMQLREWQVQSQNDPPLTMAVNLSGKQLQDPLLPIDVARIVEDTGINPRHVTLEMTESVLLSDADAVVQQLERLREIGVRLAIDDFGTGYSSLSYLRHFPVDVLKIDRSFVHGLGQESQDLALVQAIMSLGDVMKLQTVAEGIENVGELEELKKIGCHLGQGFLFAKPANSREITKLLNDQGTLGKKQPKSKATK